MKNIVLLIVLSFLIFIYPVFAAAPLVTVTSPNGGEVWAGIQDVTWTATDADNDPLSIEVQYSANNGADWAHIAFPENIGSYGVDTTALTALSGDGNQYLIRVIASDGTDAVQDDSDAVFTVDNTAPEVIVPINIPGVEATDSLGAAVSFEVTASDNIDGPITPSCDYNSGDTFPLGFIDVTCTATDSAGNTGSASFTIEVVDITPPSVTVPADILGVEATDSSGATVSFEVTAFDDIDGPTAVSCDFGSGDIFSLGNILVTCTATDNSGNSHSNSFTIQVVDTTAPEITAPGSIIEEATGPLTIVDIGTPTVTDIVDLSPTIYNDAPESFPVGITIVTWTAMDGSSNSATAMQDITIQDTTPPIIDPHNDVTKTTSTESAVVEYTLPATHDLVDGDGTASCFPASGSEFDMGDTIVTCDAVDAAGNQLLPGISFTVHVLPATTPVYVDDDFSEGSVSEGLTFGYNAFSTIQDGIEGVAESGTVNVAPGTYYESLIVNKPLSLIGPGINAENTTTVNPGCDYGLTIASSRVTVQGFYFNAYDEGNDNYFYCKPVIRVNGIYDADTGEYIADATNVTITENDIAGGYRGINLRYDSSGSTISNNVIHDNSVGIKIGDSKDNTIFGNEVYVNYDGIQFETTDEGDGDVSGNAIILNNIHDNTNYGLYLGYYVTFNELNIISNGITNNGGQGVYFERVAGSTDWLTITSNKITNNSYDGIYINNEVTNSNVNISENNITGNGVSSNEDEGGSHYGIYINSVDGNSQVDIHSNNISENSGSGIYFDNQITNIDLTNNNINNNGERGIYIQQVVAGTNGEIIESSYGLAESSDWLTISSNEITNNNYDGIYINTVTGSNVNISGNNITLNGVADTSYYGIYIYSVDESSHVDIDSNNISQNGGSEIYLDSLATNVGITSNYIMHGGIVRFNNPSGVAVDSDGNVYVADQNNNRIQKFDSEGNFLLKWGTQGGAEGQFVAPLAVAVDPVSGDVYVADNGDSNRIQKFDSDGNFILMFGWGVLDGANEFQICTYSCTSLSGPGSGAGQFNNPSSITVGSLGNIYVADTYNQRIQKFDSDGNFLLMFGQGVLDGTAEFQVCTAEDNDNAPCHGGGGTGTGDGEFNYPMGVSVDSSGNIYVANSNVHRIEKFHDDDTNTRESISFVANWGKEEDGFPTFGTSLGEFNSPSGIVIDASGNNVYIADSNNNRIQKFDSDGNFLLMFGQGVLDGTAEFQVCTAEDNANTPCHGGGGSGVSEGEFDYPRAVAVDSLGNIYIADQNNNRIQKFDSDGNFLLKWGNQGGGSEDAGIFVQAAFGNAAHENVIIGNRDFGVYNNDNENIFNAEKNYLGSISPDFDTIISGNVNYTPWYIDSDLTMLVSTQLEENETIADEEQEIIEEDVAEVIVPLGSPLENIIVNFTDESKDLNISLAELINESGEVKLVNNFTLTRDTDTVNYTAEIPAGTVISGGSDWDGKINVPTIRNAAAFSAPSGSVDVVVDVGSGTEINFSNPVKIIIGGKAGKKAAWARGTSSLTEITTLCNDVNNPTNINPTSPRECYIDSGSDLIIWTYHFTEFAAYTPASGGTGGVTDGGGGGGAPTSGGGGFIITIPKTTTPAATIPTTPTEPTETEEASAEVTEETAPETGEVITQSTPTGAVIGTTAKTGIGALIAIIIIVGGLLVFAHIHGGMPGSDNFTRAANFHRRAETHYKKGNSEKASQLYNKANELRKK